MQLRPTVNGKRWAQGTFRPTLDQKGHCGLHLTKKVYFGQGVAENTLSGQIRTFSAKARPKTLFRPTGGRKHPFRPTGASFDFSPQHAIVSEFAIKYVMVLKKKSRNYVRSGLTPPPPPPPVAFRALYRVLGRDAQLL